MFKLHNGARAARVIVSVLEEVEAEAGWREYSKKNMFEGVGNDDRTIGSGSHVSAGHTPDIYAEDSTTEDGSVDDDASGSKRDCPKATSR